MVSTYDIIKAVIFEIGSLMPNLKFEIEKVSESVPMPKMCIFQTFGTGSKSSYLFKKQRVTFQLIYFENKDNDGNRDGDKKFLIIERLEPFLSASGLRVKDRFLKFSVEVSSADDNPCVFLSFDFFDDAINKEFQEHQSRESIEKIVVNLERKEDD